VEHLEFGNQELSRVTENTGSCVVVVAAAAVKNTVSDDYASSLAQCGAVAQ
jgi:hypothetical protein